LVDGFLPATYLLGALPLGFRINIGLMRMVDMKYTLVVILNLINSILALAQNDSSRVLLEAIKRSRVYYVDLGKTDALVFEMGSYYGAAPRGYRIASVDTLVWQSDSTYTGKKVKIIQKDGSLTLIRDSKKMKREMLLMPVVNTAVANEELNNAYYLDRYSVVNTEVDHLFRMYSHPFEDRYDSWEKLKNKRMNHSEFRIFTDARIKYIRDSTVERHNRYLEIMNYLIQNISIIEYAVLRDSLAKLPMDDVNSYYKRVVYEVANNKPEFFFRLVEDHTFTKQNYLFYSIGARDKEVLKKLESVAGHDKIKRDFFRDIKSRKIMPVAGMGLAIIELAGFIALMSVIF
jgi:hypothetical protein